MICEAGKYSAIGSPTCAFCEKGKYGPNPGASFCIGCKAGKYSTVEGSKTSMNCLICDAGRFSVAGSYECKKCEENQVRNIFPLLSPSFPNPPCASSTLVQAQALSAILARLARKLSKQRQTTQKLHAMKPMGVALTLAQRTTFALTSRATITL
jgi:hypothetical protein